MTRTTCLLAVTSLSAVLAAAAPGRAQSTQECDGAYRQTQLSRRDGKLIDARAQALLCVAKPCPESNKKDCLQWLTEIEASMPTVVFAATDSAGGDTLAVRLLIDGKVFAEKLDGKAMPLDPGEHTLRFELAGVAPIERPIVIKEGEKNRQVSVSFKATVTVDPDPQPSGAAVITLPTGTAVAGAPSAVALAQPPGTPTWAWVTGGVSLALLGVAAGFGADGLGAVSALEANCGKNYSTEPCQAKTEYDWASDNARKNRDLGIFLGAAGLGVIGIGISIYGLVSARPVAVPLGSGRAPLVPTLRLGLGSMIVQGGF